MKEEKIIKGYDPAILKRLFTFLKPYRPGVIIAIIALLIATALELALPVIIQRAIDNDVLPLFMRVKKNGESIQNPTPYLESGEWFYFRKQERVALAGSIKEMERIDTNDYYLFRPDGQEEDLTALLEDKKEYFIIDGEIVLVRTMDMKALGTEDKKIIRKQNIINIKNASLDFLFLLMGVLVFTFLQIYLMAYIGQSVMKDLRLKLFSHTMGQSLGYLSVNPVGKMVTRITNDVETINEFFTTIITSVLKDISMLTGVIVVLFLLDKNLGLVTVCSLPPILIITYVFSRKARNAFRKVRLWVSKVNSFLSEHISGIAVVQMFNNQNKSDKEFDGINGNLLKANLGQMYIFATFRPLIDLFASVSIAVVIYAGAVFFRMEIVSLGILIAFLNLITKFYQPVRDISDKFTILQSAMAGGERLFHQLDTDEKIADEGTRQITGAKGKIRFDSVSFAYKKDEPVLRNLSLDVNPGETVAIVGYTGAGKTTITNLLTRLWDIEQGTIYLDDTDIKEFSLPALRKVVMPVLQDVFLFSGTVEDNIRMGSSITTEQVEEAARIVQADGFIKNLPGGYQTVLNERGSNLSTGQRQLISFARIVAHNPSIIILDEATGNIDTETEKLIEKALDKLLEDRTSLVIAHRLSTIRHADRILVLSYGRLAEDGTHDELMEKKGIYFNLYNLQFTKSGS